MMRCDGRKLIGFVEVGAADAATHKIYVWDVSNDGQLSSTLDGGREPLIHLHVPFFFPYPLSHSSRLTVAPDEIHDRLHDQRG
jgi:hypothetical protein